MWNDLIQNGWHPHEIEVYTVLWEYMFHPTATFIFLIITIVGLTTMWYYAIQSNWYNDALPPITVMATIFSPGIYLAIPFLFVVIIYTSPIWGLMLLTWGAYKLFKYLKSEIKLKKYSDKIQEQNNYKENLLKELN
jgi:hypothetical protein